MIKKIIIISIIIGVLFPNFSFAQEQPPITPPETIEEAKKIGEKALGVGEKQLPGIIEKIWVEEDSFFSTFAFPSDSEGGRRKFTFFDLALRKLVKEEVLPIWQKMWNWFNVNIWLEIHDWLKTEIDKRKQFLKEGFEGEKEEIREELKTEVPKVGKSLWEKLKELVK